MERAQNPHIRTLSPPLDMAEKWFALIQATRATPMGVSTWNCLSNELLCCGSILLGDQHGYRHCEVVQFNEGLWIHSAARRRQRCVRAHQCRRTCRPDVAQRRTDRSIRN